MAGSDLTPVIISDEVALDADGISTAASVGNNAALTIGGALADSGSVTNASGRQVTILSAGNDSGNFFYCCWYGRKRSCFKRNRLLEQMLEQQQVQVILKLLQV